jgi:hypothetical protein
MKNMQLFAVVFLFGLFIAAGNTAGFEQERQERMQRQQESAQIDQLPQAVRETLQDDYEDWQPVKASRATDPEEGEFYMIKLDHREDHESKIVMVDDEGDVIEEEEVMMLRQHEGLHQRREEMPGRDDGQHRDDQQGGRQYTPAVYEQERRVERERSSPTDSLPQPVEATLMDDFDDWSPTEAHLATDPEDQTVYYIIKMHNAGEGDTKIVRISSDGEVIDEQKINPLDNIGDLDDNDNGNNGWRDDDNNDDGVF